MRALWVCLLVLVLPASAQGAIEWQRAQPIPEVKRFRDVSCSAGGLCVAVGGENSSLVVSRTGGRDWDAAMQLGPPQSDLFAVACPTDSGCVMIGASRTGPDRAAYALASNNPSDPASWTRTRLDGLPYGTVSCTGALCVADTTFGLYVTSNAFDPAPAWTLHRAAAGIRGVQCRAPTFCAGISSEGIVVSAAPSDPDAAWTLAYAGAVRQLSCPTSTACFARTQDGTFLVWDGAAWSGFLVPGLPEVTLSCPAVDQCVGLADNGRDAFVTRTPASATPWEGSAPERVARSPSSMACFAVDRCVVVGFTGWITAGVARTGSSMWSAPRTLDPAARLRDVRCPTEELCLALSRGRVYRSTTPMAGTFTMAPAESIPEAAGRITCTSLALCTATEGRRTLTFNPAGGPWHRNGRARSDLGEVDCPTARLCVAAGGGAGPVVSTDGGRTWSPRKTDRVVRFLTVSCPSARLCVAAGSLSGRVGYLRNPARRDSRWRVTRLGAPRTPQGHSTNPSFGALECPSERLCVAADWRGRIVTTTRPTGGRSAWRLQTLKGFLGRTGGGAVGLSCPTTRFCAAVDGSGVVAHTTDPAAGAASWETTAVFARRSTQTVASVSCPTERFCMAGYANKLAVFKAP